MIIFSKKNIFQFLRKRNDFYLNKRKIFNVTKHWHVTCTFDDHCLNDLMKRFENYWDPILKQKWVDYCEKNKNKPTDRYILSMFPYPSGSLHLGHSRLFTTSDSLIKYNMIKKRKVCHPLGWDSFGLPAENAAILNSLDPNNWTSFNIKKMKSQLSSLGLNFNCREATSDPNFYKWTQWLFLKLYENKLAYKTFSSVNWDPIDCTVLAKEQIDENGNSWRSGAKVEKRFMKQWYIKTSYFIDELFRSENVNMDKLGWDQLVRIQRSWFKKPNTFLFYLKINEDIVLPVTSIHPEIFLDENCYLDVSDDHWLKTLNETKLKNPFTNKYISIEFNKSLNEEFFTQLKSKSNNFQPNENLKKKVLNVCKSNNSLGGYFVSDKFHDWLVSRQRFWGTPIPMIECKNCGIQPLTEDCLPVKLPKIDNYVESSKKKDSLSMNKLTELAPDSWIETKCPKCNSLAKRETDTLDTFVDSSWYFLRYANDPNVNEPYSAENCKKPVWLYLGGSEHCNGHLFYARFIYHFLKNFNYLDSESYEPFDKILFLGMVNGKAFKYEDKYLNLNELENIKKSSSFDATKLTYKYEKMSKSKMNGISPELLVKNHGIDITRYCVLGYTSSQKTLNWKGEKQEFNEGMRTLRKFILTVDQFIYLKRLENEKPSSPVVKIYSKHKLKDNLNDIIINIKENRKRYVQEITNCFENDLKPGKASKLLQEYVQFLRKYVLIDKVVDTKEFERAIADIIIMYSPLTPHLSEELWSGFSYYNKHLKNDKIYYFDKFCFEQNWPEIDDSLNQK